MKRSLKIGLILLVIWSGMIVGMIISQQFLPETTTAQIIERAFFQLLEAIAVWFVFSTTSNLFK